MPINLSSFQPPSAETIATAVVAQIPSSTPRYYTAQTTPSYVSYTAPAGSYLINCATSVITYVAFYASDGSFVTSGQTSSGTVQLSVPSNATRLQFRASTSNVVFSILPLGSYSTQSIGTLTAYTSSTTITLGAGESMHCIAIGAGGGGGPGVGWKS